MKKFLYLTIIISIFSSCARQKLKKTIEAYRNNTFFVYTDDLAKTQNIFGDTDIYISNLPQDETFILPNSMIILWHTSRIPNIKYLKREINHNPIVYRFDEQAINNTEFINYFLDNISLIKTIYTDSVRFFYQNKKYQNYNIKNLTGLDSEQILSGIAIAVIFKQNFKLKDFKPFTNGQIKIYSNIYRPKEKIFSEILKYKRLLNFDTIYTNNTKLLYELLDSQIIMSNLTNLKASQIDSFTNLINRSRAIIVIFKYPQSIQIKDKTIIQAIKTLQTIDKDFIQIYLPNQNLFLLEKAKKLTLKYHPQIIYTNNPEFISHLFDSLTIQYKNITLTKKSSKKDTIPFLQKIKTISDQTQNGISLVFYLSKNRDSLKTLAKLYKNYFHNCVIIESNAGIIIYSKYLADTIFVSLYRKILSKHNFKHIISTKPTLTRILAQNSTGYKYQNFPSIINLQTGEKNKLYNRKLLKLKKQINGGQALVVIFQDKTDSIREPYEKLVSHFIAPVYSMKTTPTSTLIYSRYIDKKVKILQLLDTNYQIFTNKPAILEHIYGLSEQKVSKMPQRCIPPSCATNSRFEPQMSQLRRNIIIKNAQVVYFIDPTDSIYPNEKLIRNEFRFFKFTKFDGGYVIKNYEGY